MKSRKDHNVGTILNSNFKSALVQTRIYGPKPPHGECVYCVKNASGYFQ